MIHILHLSSVGAEFQTRASIEHLTDNLGPGFSARSESIGFGGDYLNVPTAIYRLRKTARRNVHLIHAWDTAALSAAAMSGCRRIVYSPPPEISQPVPGEGEIWTNGLRWFHRILKCPEIQVIFPSTTLQQLYEQQGVIQTDSHVIYPAVDLNRISPKRNVSLRAELGFSDSDFVLLAPGESTRAAGHDSAVWAAAILNALDPQYRLVLQGWGPQALAIQRFGKRLRQEGFYRLANQQLGRDVELEALAGVADAALVAIRGFAAMLPVAICMAAGLPIVSSLNSPSARVLEDRQTALVTSRATPRSLAQRVIDLRAEAGLSQRLAQAARTKAEECFSLDRFLNQWRDVYRQTPPEDARGITNPQANTARSVQLA